MGMSSAQVTLFEKDDVVNLISMSQAVSPWIGDVVNLIYSHGLRVSELLQVVKTNNLDFVMIKRAKNGYDSYHEIQERSQKSIAALRNMFSEELPCIRTMQRHFKALIQLAIKEGVLGEQFSKARLHDLRHSCAVHLVKNGVAINAIQRYLGHKSIGSTEYYVRTFSDYGSYSSLFI